MSVIRNILKLFASVPPPPAATTTTLPPEVPPDVPYVRFAEESDLRGLLRVERSTRQAEYWNASDFRTALRHPKIRLVLVELNGRVIGYVAVEVRSRHLAIRALAVHKDSQRQGVGSSLVAVVQRHFGPNSRDLVVAVVREEDLPVQQFLKACGFRCKKVVRDAYEDPSDNAYVFEWHSHWGDE
jgi:ribosomal-protein-alanine N-acetyltransferase